MRRAIAFALALLVLAPAGVARAWVHEGEPAPAFSKRALAGGPPWSAGANVSLADHAVKVVVLFLMGCT